MGYEFRYKCKNLLDPVETQLQELLSHLEVLCKTLPKSPPDDIVNRVRGIVEKQAEELTDDEKKPMNIWEDEALHLSSALGMDWYLIFKTISEIRRFLDENPEIKFKIEPKGAPNLPWTDSLKILDPRPHNPPKTMTFKDKMGNPITDFTEYEYKRKQKATEGPFGHTIFTPAEQATEYYKHTTLWITAADKDGTTLGGEGVYMYKCKSKKRTHSGDKKVAAASSKGKVGKGGKKRTKKKARRKKKKTKRKKKNRKKRTKKKARKTKRRKKQRKRKR